MVQACVEQVELTEWSGGTKRNTDHSDFYGTGFVDGYYQSSANLTFTVRVPKAGP